MKLTFCPAITTRSPSRIPMEASCVLALSERAGRTWLCSVRGRGELGLGRARLSRVRSSLATAAASAISRGISSGSGTTSAGHCPLSFWGKRVMSYSRSEFYFIQSTCKMQVLKLNTQPAFPELQQSLNMYQILMQSCMFGFILIQ